MNEFYDLEIERLHQQLAAIYRRGYLTTAEQLQVKGLWARIERLEATRAKIEVKEARYGVVTITIPEVLGMDNPIAGVFGTNRGGRR